MKKNLVIMAVCCLVVACSGVQKPPLSETQMVDGKSIVIPPEFDVVPNVPKEAVVKADKNEKPAKPAKKEIKKENKGDKK